MSANPKDPTINWEKLAPLIPHPGRYPILQELSAKQQVALLCRVLFKEGYNDHIAGPHHVSPGRRHAAGESVGTRVGRGLRLGHPDDRRERQDTRRALE